MKKYHFNFFPKIFS
jgi:hypothetical protein